MAVSKFKIDLEVPVSNVKDKTQEHAFFPIVMKLKIIVHPNTRTLFKL